MDLELLVSLAVGQLGKEKVETTLKAIIDMANKTDLKTTYIIKRLPSKGVCLLTTNDDEMQPIVWKKNPKIKELQKMLTDIEI